MCTKFVNHVVYLLAVGLGIALTACQPIQAPPQPVVAANAPDLNGVKRSPGGPTVAFVHEQILYMHPGTLAVTVEDCTIGCHVYYLTWSPDGKRLAYFYRPATAAATFEIRLTDLTGQVQRYSRVVVSKAGTIWGCESEPLLAILLTAQRAVPACCGDAVDVHALIANQVACPAAAIAFGRAATDDGPIA